MESKTKWYTVKVMSNRERIVSERLKSEMDRNEVESKVIVPMEKVYFAKNGKKAHRDKIMYPGYIFVETASLAVLQEALKLVSNNSGILKSKTGEPSFLRQDEIDKMINDANKPEVDIDFLNFVVGETVRINGGPFDNFKGEVEEINKEKGKVKVNVLIFGRSTPVDLQIDQIEKIIE